MVASPVVLCFVFVFQISGSFQGFSPDVMLISLKVTGLCTSYAHACINPIIYTFAAPLFRNHIFKDIKCFVCQAVNKLCCCPKTQGTPHSLKRIDPAENSIQKAQDDPSATAATSSYLR